MYLYQYQECSLLCVLSVCSCVRFHFHFVCVCVCVCVRVCVCLLVFSSGCFFFSPIRKRARGETRGEVKLINMELTKQSAMFSKPSKISHLLSLLLCLKYCTTTSGNITLSKVDKSQNWPSGRPGMVSQYMLITFRLLLLSKLERPELKMCKLSKIIHYEEFTKAVFTDHNGLLCWYTYQLLFITINTSCPGACHRRCWWKTFKQNQWHWKWSTTQNTVKYNKLDKR